MGRAAFRRVRGRTAPLCWGKKNGEQARSCSRLPRRGGNSWSFGRREVREGPAPQGSGILTAMEASEGELGAAKPYPTLGELRSSTQGSEVPPVPSGQESGHLAPPGGPREEVIELPICCPNLISSLMGFVRGFKALASCLNHLKTFFFLKRNLLPHGW